MKKILAGIIVVSLLTIVMSGCAKKVDKEMTVYPKIKWYVMFQEQQDASMVMEAINKITRDKIGAEVDIARLDLTGYSEKIKLIIAAKEKFDLFFTSPSYGYNTYVKNGALQPLDDLLKQYAPKSYAQIPEEYWNAAKTDGKIYGFINYQIAARRNGFAILKDSITKTNFDISSIKNMYDLDPLLAKIKETSPAGTVAFAAQPSCVIRLMQNDDIFQLVKGVGYFDNSDSDYKFFNLYESSNYKKGLDTIRKWYLNGYIDKDAATASNVREKIGSGNVKIWLESINPGVEPALAQMAGGRDVETVITDKAVVSTSSIIATMQGLSATSENPELAVKFLELMNTNVDNIYNIINFGLEGTHYKKVNDKRIELVANSGYNPNMAWEFGNQFNAYLLPGQKDTLWQDTIDLNNSAYKSGILGFMFNPDPVKNEIALCSSVIEEYSGGLETGSVDPDVYLPKFLEKLKNAGIDKVLQESQKQLYEWRNNKK